MRIGVPKEIKNNEYRVGLTPESVFELVRTGHDLIVEHAAGSGIGAEDSNYQNAGATIVASAKEIFDTSDLVVKVKEPLSVERALLRPGQTLFTYLHLAPDRPQATELMQSGAIAIAYETVTSAEGTLPLLAPMSEVAGRMAAQVAAHYLERPHGGRGVLISGATGVAAAQVLILGAGVVGSNAARVAAGMGARVTLMNPSGKLPKLAAQYAPNLDAQVLNARNLELALRSADAVVGAVLIPGGLAPKLVTRDMLAYMKPGAVVVDVSIDQGGCFETSRPTTHAEPVYTVDGILHYCVANMPGAVPHTSTYALNHATLPFVKALASQGVVNALRSNSHLLQGLNICAGVVTRREVAAALGLPYTDPKTALMRYL